MINVAICGCGSIAELRHAPEFAGNPDVKLAGFYDPVTARADGLASRFGGAVYPSAEALLTDPSVDAVSLCTTNVYHCRYALLAFEHGKHVLCEKPMAVTVEEGESMVRAAKQAGKKLMIAENQRLAPAHTKAREIIASGGIGKVLSFRTIFGHRGPEYWAVDKNRSTWFFDRGQAQFGSVGDIGIHKINVMRWLLGDEVEEVQAVLLTLDKRDAAGQPIGVDDNGAALLKFRNGVLGVLVTSWTYYGDEDVSTVLFGTEGVLRIYDDPSFPVTVTTRSGEKAFYKLGGIPTNEVQFKTGIIDKFVECIVNDSAPFITGEDGLEDLKVVVAIAKASASGVRTRV